MAKAKAKQNSVRADGRVQVSLEVGRATGGKRTRKYFYGRTMDEAAAKRDAYMAAHPPEAPEEWRDATVGQWAERWLTVYNAGVTDKTMDGKRTAVRAIKKFAESEDGTKMGDMRLSEVRPSHVQAALSSKAGKSKTGIAVFKSTLRSIFDTAADEGIISSSPCGSLKSPKRGEYVGHRDLTEQEQAIVAKAYPYHRAGLWMMLMMYAGLRREETAALLWSDIDMEAKTISVRRAAALQRAGKTKATKTLAGVRVIPIVPPLYVALDAVAEEKRAGLVCRNAKGGALSGTSFDQALGSFLLVCERVANDIEPYDHTAGWRRNKAIKAAEEKGIPYVAVSFTAHDLRYTYATILYEAEVDVKTAAYLLGHKDVMVTMRIYTQLTERKKTISVDKLMQYFAPDDE